MRGRKGTIILFFSHDVVFFKSEKMDATSTALGIVMKSKSVEVSLQMQPSFYIIMH